MSQAEKQRKQEQDDLQADVEKAAKIRRLGETEILNKQRAELAQDWGVPWPPQAVLKLGRPKLQDRCGTLIFEFYCDFHSFWHHQPLLFQMDIWVIKRGSQVGIKRSGVRIQAYSASTQVSRGVEGLFERCSHGPGSTIPIWFCCLFSLDSRHSCSLWTFLAISKLRRH